MFNFRNTLITLVSFLGMLVGQAAEQPNFIIIFTDDQGYKDLSCFGSPKIKTPKIDQMALEGSVSQASIRQTRFAPHLVRHY